MHNTYLPEITLHYSKLLSIPILGRLLYGVQRLSVYRKCTTHFFVSLKTCSAQQRMIEISTASKADRLYFSDPKLHHLVKKIEAKMKIFDLSSSVTDKYSSQARAYEIMWSLIVADKITPSTKTKIFNMIPNIYPIQHNIVIPYHEADGVLCNFVLETAKALSKNGHKVTLIAHNAQKSTKLDGVTVFTPIALLPRHIKVPYKLKKIEEILKTFFISRYIRKNKTTLLWTFDHLDLELAKAVKKICNDCKIIYDCVDFYSSRDPLTHKITSEREKKHIKEVDICFVNSKMLLSKKKSLNQQTILTYQGFDITSFSSKVRLNSTEVIALQKIRNTLKNNSNPVFGFVGNVDYRLDFVLLKNIVAHNQHANFVFTESIITTTTEDKNKNVAQLVAHLKKNSNVLFIPATSNRYFIKELISLFDVGIIPYDVRIPLVKNSFPMKFFEYLYCGIDILSTPIVELGHYPEFVHVAANKNEWNGFIKNYIKKIKESSKIRKMRNLALQNSWENKVTNILQKVDSFKTT